jgi:hypothetical protein
VSRSRTATAIAGVVASLAVTVALWIVFDTAVFFLIVPVVPFLFRLNERNGSESRRDRRVCPRCDFETTATDVDYCPRDGRRLERAGRAGDETRRP